MTDDELPAFAIRLSSRAYREMEEAMEGLNTRFGFLAARDWQDGFFEAISHLATGPYRALIPEQELFTREMRQILYRSNRPVAVYRILFEVRTDTEDAPHVRILTLRHGSARPIQPYEARQIENE